MKVSAQRLPQSQVVLEIEVDPEQMERSLEKAYRRLAQRIEVPGFRKGKTPRPMLERHVGRQRLLREALDILIPEAYNRAIDEHEVEAIDEPVIELLSEEPAVFKATVPVRPTVELGDYRKLRVERPPAETPTEEVDAALEELRHRYALHEPVDRAVRQGDIVRADVRAVVEGREVFADQDAEFRLRDGAIVLVPGLAEGLVGAEKGTPREVHLTMPAGSQSLSGKEAVFTVIVKEVKEERLPDLNDEFAREVGEGFPGLQALRRQLEENLRERRQAQAEEEHRDKLVEALVAQARTIEFPPVLVEREIDRLLREQARAAGQDVDRYLQMMRRSLEELRQEFRPLAEERVRRPLALGRLSELEEISVEPAEIDGEIERMVGSAGAQAGQVRALLSSPDGREALRRSLLSRKTVDRLVELTGRDNSEKLTQKRKKRSTKAGSEEDS